MIELNYTLKKDAAKEVASFLDERNIEYTSEKAEGNYDFTTIRIKATEEQAAIIRLSIFDKTHEIKYDV